MNRLSSTAVMARRVEPPNSLDYFPTPPWATRALCEHVLPNLPDVPAEHYGRCGYFPYGAWEPACGEGHMAVALAEYFAAVHASDIHPYGFGSVFDFLEASPQIEADWIITNPPFNKGLEFARVALELASCGVAMLVRTQFLEGQERFRELFARRPPAIVAQFVERVPMHRGKWEPDGSTATAYCWIVWLTAEAGDHTRFLWIPPSRKALTKPDDAMRFNAAAPVPLFGE